MAPKVEGGLIELAKLALSEVLSHGRLPAADLTKALISKVGQGLHCWAALPPLRKRPGTRRNPPPSQGLGYGIVAGSTLVKVPQLLNVVRAKSAEGLSPLSLELETVSLAIATTYGFINQLPITAFGEVVVRGGGWGEGASRRWCWGVLGPSASPRASHWGGAAEHR